MISSNKEKHLLQYKKRGINYQAKGKDANQNIQTKNYHTIKTCKYHELGLNNAKWELCIQTLSNP